METVTGTIESRPVVCAVASIICFQCNEFPLLEVVIKTQIPSLIKMDSSIFLCRIKLQLLVFFSPARRWI